MPKLTQPLSRETGCKLGCWVSKLYLLLTTMEKDKSVEVQ